MKKNGNLVGISLCVHPQLLKKIIDNVKGDSVSEKLRTCLSEGYKSLNGELK